MTARLKVHVGSVLPDQVWEDLNEAFDITASEDPFIPVAELVELLRGKDALLSAVPMPLSKALIDALPDSVRAIGTYSVGYDHVNIEAARARGIAVFNTPDVLTPSVAENALFLMLGAARRGTESIDLIRSRRWPGWSPRQLNGHELWRKSLGIFGMGRIGRAIAQRARGFEMSIHYNNRSRLAASLEDGATFHARVEDMLPLVDVLMLVAPSTPETRGFLNAARVKLLKPEAIVVNIGRGDLVVDEALIGALSRHEIFSAGLDVFNHEPRLDPRYYELPNVFMLPHIGSSTVEARRRMGLALREGLLAWSRGEPAANRLA